MAAGPHIKVLRLFLSLRTAIWLLLALLGLLFYGSIVMPLNPEFGALQAVPLFTWLLDNPPVITWWIWASIAVLSLLTANTLLCSMESVFRKRTARQWLLLISPQVIHVGFLFVLLAHLLSSYGSFKGTAAVYAGSSLALPDGESVIFDRIDTKTNDSGYIEDWSVAVRYFRDEREVAHDLIEPNSPSFRKGLGIYVRSVRAEPFPAALVEVSREPGAPWALAGGILFLAGMVTLLVLKAGREGAVQKGQVS
jgi:hypothetical protein